YWIRRTLVERARTLAETAAVSGIAAALMAALWWLCGAWIIHYKDGGGGTRYGVYSFNLLGFFDAAGASLLIPGVPRAHAAQYEGFAWLGRGVLALLAVLGAEALSRGRRPHLPRRHWPLAAIAILTVAYAASTVLTLGPWTLIDVPVRSPIFATFRASGRFIW